MQYRRLRTPALDYTLIFINYLISIVFIYTSYKLILIIIMFYINYIIIDINNIIKDTFISY